MESPKGIKTDASDTQLLNTVSHGREIISLIFFPLYPHISSLYVYIDITT